MTTFPKSSRLRNAREFERVFSMGSRSRDDCFVVIGAASPAQEGDAGARLGLAISKKVAPRAVDRNRLKRVIRETFRQQQWLWMNTRVDLVVLARRGSLNCDNSTLRASLRGHWQHFC